MRKTAVVPYICRECRAQSHRTSITARAFTTSRARGEKRVKVAPLSNRDAQLHPSSKYSASFPRWQVQEGVSLVTAQQFCLSKTAPWGQIGNGEIRFTKTCTVYGRVISCRVHGNKLVFIDIASGGETVQVLLNARDLFPEDAPVSQGHTFAEFTEFRKNVKRGDYVAVTGHPSRSTPTNHETDIEGRKTLRATKLPQVLSPSLEVLPLDVSNPEVLMRNRHLDMLLHPSVTEPLVVRHRILKTFRDFFDKNGFVEVSTPLIVAGAGGAVARPFDTYATEFPSTPLNLRVAPELWLKRLIMGGMERIFEIGPAFRNEGVDNTHNPEFTICEFYRVMTTLDQLISTTESLFHKLALATQAHQTEHPRTSTPAVDPTVYAGPYPRLEFIPTLEREMHAHIPHWTCPDLSQPASAQPLLAAACAHLHLPVPGTLPALLDALAAHLLEPLCVGPTFITHHPECMSPLAKSFARAHPGGVVHRVAARAELFVAAREYVNCYEEENSPVAQRRKFVEQLRFRDKAESGGVDESYLAALESGMPPTGGWGCGVDRVVMLFSGRGRIADVLPFGTLRNVVALGTGGVSSRKAEVEVDMKDVKEVKEEKEGKRDEGRLMTLEEAWSSGLKA